MKLGLWAPYIDEPKMFSWYKLPVELSQDLKQFVPDGTELEALSSQQWRKVHQAAVRYANDSVSAACNPYHNGYHFQVVEERGMAVVQAYERLRRVKVPEAVKQALTLALRLHDCHHCGATLRADARKPLYRPDLGRRVSQEWVSAQAADKLARQHGLSVPARLFIVMIIWSSTYGGHTSRGRKHNVPDVQPVSFWGKLMRAADVCLDSDSFTNITQSVAIGYGEVPIIPASTTWEGFITGELAFLDYVTRCFSQLDAAAGAGITAALGWQTAVARMRSRVRALSDTTSADARRVAKVFSEYSVVLT